MRLMFASLLLLLPLQSSAAQWHVTAMHGSGTVSGHSRDDSGPEVLGFLPDRPSSFALAIGHDLGGIRVSLEVRRTSADLALRGDNTLIVTTGALHAWGGALEGARRVVGRDGQPTLRAGLGLLAERWTFDIAGSDPRWRAAARGALEVTVPIAGHWNGVLRGELAAGPSLFRLEELPEGYGRRMGWRRGIVLGIGWAK